MTRFIKWKDRFTIICWKNLFYYKKWIAITIFITLFVFWVIMLSIVYIRITIKDGLGGKGDTQSTLETSPGAGDWSQDLPVFFDPTKNTPRRSKHLNREGVRYKVHHVGRLGEEYYEDDMDDMDDLDDWHDLDDIDFTESPTEDPFDKPKDPPFGKPQFPDRPFEPPNRPSGGQSSNIMYAPKPNPVVAQLMAEFEKECMPIGEQVNGFESEGDMVEWISDNGASGGISELAGKEGKVDTMLLSFDNTFKSWNDNLTYKIIIKTHSMTSEEYSTYVPCEVSGGMMGHPSTLRQMVPPGAVFPGGMPNTPIGPIELNKIPFTFLAKKLCLDKIYLKKKKLDMEVAGCMDKIIPLPSFKWEGCVGGAFHLGTLICLMTAILIFLAYVLILEKMTMFETLFEQMGITFWIRYLSWAVWLIPFFVFAWILMVVFPYATKTTNTKFPFVLIVYTIFYCGCVQAYTLLLYVCTVKFSQIALGAVIFCSPFLLVSYWVDFSINMSAYQHIVMFFCYLFPTGNLVQAHNMMKQCEAYGYSLTSYGGSPLISWRNYPRFYMLILHLILLTILYVFLAWFIDFARHNEMLRNFFRCKWKRLKKSNLDKNIEEIYGEGFEAPATGPTIEPYSGKLVIQTKNLVKKFVGRRVVDDLNMDVFGNMITILLGHNGAGKSTTINILLDLYEKTSGIIRTDPPLSSGDWGYCPQHTLIISELDIRSHLYLFARLRGLDKSDANVAVIKTLHLCKLTHLQNHKGKKVSGGQQRMTNIGMSLIGNTKILILDEPTAGLDAENKGRIWDTLLSLRATHTIFMTTHSMEEAEILADRVIIMYAGKVISAGTTTFLKQLYGVGYTVSVLGQKGYKPETTVLEFIRNYAPKVRIDRLFTQSAVYALEYLPNETILALLTALNDNKEELKIQHATISFMNLEEVFVKSGEMAGDHTILEEKIYESDETYKNKCLILIEQFFALLIKRPFIIGGSCWQIVVFLVVYLLVFILAFLCWGGEYKNVQAVNIQRFYKSHILIGSGPSKQSKDFATKMASYIGKHASATVVPSARLRGRLVSLAQQDVDTYLRETPLAIDFAHWPVMCVYHNPVCPLAGILAADILTSTVACGSVKNTYTGIKVGASFGDKIKDLMLPVLIMLIIFQGIMFVYVLNLQINETQLNFKRMQILSGVPRILYWAATAFWDLIFCWLAYGIMCIAFAISGNYPPQGTGTLFGVTTVFCLGMLPIVYLLCYRDGVACGILTLWITLTVGMLLSLLCYFIALGLATSGRTFLKYILYLLTVCFPTINFGYYLFISPKYAPTDQTKKSGSLEINLQMFNSADLNWNEVNIMYVAMGMTTLAIFWYIFQMIDSGYGMLCCVHCCGDKGIPVDMEEIKYIAPKDRDKKKITRVKQKDKILEKGPDEDIFKENEVVDYMCANACKLKPLTPESGIVSDQQKYDVMPDVVIQKIQQNYRFGSCCQAGFAGVRDVSFAVEQGICFGLLGVNGAGKTSLFKCIVGEHFQRKGRVYFYGRRRHMFNQSCLQMGFGYCPQEDAVHPHLSGCLTITLFCLIKGVPFGQIKKTRKKWLEILDLQEHAKRATSHYSGGMKRRLCVALALMGKPRILFMDEPTEGIDPVGKRSVWQLIASASKKGATTILTTHSMEECESLCDRVTIMVAGRLICIGDNAYLKLKHTKGFTVMIAIQSGAGDEWRSQVEAICDEIETDFTEDDVEQAVLIQDQPTYLQYNIDKPGMEIADIFPYLDSLKQKHPLIKDYQVGESSLRQVFLSFAED